MRQKNQLELALPVEGAGESRNRLGAGTEACAANAAPESPAAMAGPCMEAIVDHDNLRRALAQVRRNKGAPGIDGMSVDALALHLKDHWPELRAQLLEGAYSRSRCGVSTSG